jgi:methionyl-tRNA formyltransferase
MEETSERGGGAGEGCPSLIFFGTPDFALPSLQKLADAGAPVLEVVTQPDRRVGRGQKLSPPPVKKLALDLSLPVYQPERLKSAEVQERLLALGAECLVVAAYGQIVPKALLDGHPLGGINVHPSLLPLYRGASPIQRAILNGDRETGVSIMLMEAGLDTGPVLMQRRVPIEAAENAGSLHDRLARIGADMLLESLIQWKAGAIRPEPQDDSRAVYAPPIEKGELAVDWKLSGEAVACTIRAFDPWPGAYTRYRGKRVKCFGAALLPWKSEGMPGEVVGMSGEALAVRSGDGRGVAVRELQMQGQRRMPAPEFLRGHPIPPGSVLE